MNKYRVGDSLKEMYWSVMLFLITVALMLAAPSVGAWLRSIA
jgi:hypothetical protein